MSIRRGSGKYDYKDAKNYTKYCLEAFLNGAIFIGASVKMMSRGLYSKPSIILTPIMIYFYASTEHKLDIISYLDAKTNKN